MILALRIALAVIDNLLSDHRFIRCFSREHSPSRAVLLRGKTSRDQRGLAPDALRNPTAGNQRSNVSIGEDARPDLILSPAV
jgi:hypothetical protein